MAEDQDQKQKVRTTLIKHRQKNEAGEDKGEKKKVRVVVRKKPKAKPRVAAKKAEADTPQTKETPPPQKATQEPAQTTASAQAEETAAKSTKGAASEDTDRTAGKPAKQTEKAPQKVEERAVAEKTTEKPEKATKKPVEAKKTQRPAQPAARADSASPKAAPRTETTRVEETPTRSDPAAAHVEAKAPKPKFGSPGRGPREGGDAGTSEQRVRSIEESPRRERVSARSGGPRRDNRSGGSGRGAPSRGGTPSRGGGPSRGGAPGRGGPPRGGPPRGGAPGRGPSPRTGGRPDQRGSEPDRRRGGDDRRSGGRKFYKTKRRESYPRREKQQEKEIQVKQKRTPRKTNPVPKSIDIMEVITVSELAKKMNLKASDLIGKLMSMGMMVTINQQIDAETATLLASEYGCEVNLVSLYDETIIESEKDEEENLQPRPPIVTVMGHVDHGKTKLLDAIRETDVVAGEHGGITQHIGAYQVGLKDGQKITFLDTPGHEAFTLMRARGAQITDVVVLVVAADDGVMPQTVEAINHAKEAKVPIIVAVNKTDLPAANPDRVKQQLSEYDLIPEDWGGNTLFVNVSALKREGIDDLLETIALQAEILELKANHDTNAEGKVIESQIDPGRGTVCTILVERGTLRVGDPFLAGIYSGRIRAMFNDRGKKVEEATPSMPVEILGSLGIPDSGDPFQVTDNEKLARQVGDKRQELKKVEEAQNVKKITLDNLYDSIQEGEVQELKVVIKGDVHGSVEALQSSLEKLSTREIRLNPIHASAGAINEGDIMLATASNAIVIGFHVRPTPRAQALAEQEKVEIRKYNVIYKAVEDIRAAMEGMLAPDLEENTVGQVDVRETFKVPRIGTIAGCYVTSGKVRRGANVHIIRDGVQVYSGKIGSLKRFKDDVREVDAGYECGIGIDDFNDIKVGDQLEVYEIREIAKTI
jgi:translation initiation factor IF-2